MVPHKEIPMKIQNKILTGIILASTLLVVGCSDDGSTSVVTGYTPPDYSSLLDQLNSDSPEVATIKEKYGECDSKKDGLVVRDVNANRYKAVCKDSSWQIVDEYSFDEDIAWYYYGSCTDKEEGEIRLPIYNNSYLEKSHICKNHSWKEIQKSTLPTCDKDHLGQVVYLGSNNAVICDEKKKWRDASIIEASWLYPNPSIDKVAGLCYKERNGERIRLDADEISSELYYKCADNVWKPSNAAEYIYGECKGAYLDSIVQISLLDKYICQDTGWHRFNLIEMGLGICTAEKQNEMGSSPYVIGFNTNVCDNEKWREATEAEKAWGVCTEEKQGETDSIHTPAEFYTCDGKYWRTATDDEIFHTRLGECTKRSLKVTVTIDTVDYICDTDGWRTKDSLEQQIGFCISTGTVKMAKDSVNYICTKGGWKVAEPPELFQGLCNKEIYGIDIVADDGLKYICEETGWRLGNELEQNIGFCNSNIEDKVYVNRQNENLSYYTCHDNNWQEATEEEILYSELGACPQYNLNVSNNYNGQKYLCEESGWRLGNEMEQAIGFCTSRTENQIDTFEETIYICSDDGWVIFNPDE